MSSGGGSVASGPGNGLREPNQNGSSRSGEPYVPLSVNVTVSSLGPTIVTGSPSCRPAVCAVLEGSAISPAAGASPRICRCSAAPSRKNTGRDGPSVSPNRTVDRPWETIVSVGTPVSAPSTAASAFAQSKSSSPNTW